MNTSTMSFSDLKTAVFAAGGNYKVGMSRKDLEEQLSTDTETSDRQDSVSTLDTAPEQNDQATATGEPVEPPSLLARVSQLIDESIAHPLVKDKSPEAIASRVARRLNSEGYSAPVTLDEKGNRVGRSYFTAKTVLGLTG